MRDCLKLADCLAKEIQMQTNGMNIFRSVSLIVFADALTEHRPYCLFMFY